MKTLRAIIADDEELARRILREYLAGEPDIEIVEECPNGFETVKAVNDLKPDMLFLDVQMPKLDGFEVLELVDSSVAVGEGQRQAGADGIAITHTISKGPTLYLSSFGRLS